MTAVRGMRARSPPDQGQWKAFVEGKIGEYLDGVQRVEALVSDTVTAFADRTATLAKNLSDTILAAVAVLLGSFIAAAFKSPFNATLFRLAVRAYAVYVLLFPGLIGVLANVSNLRATRREFDVRVNRFKETVYPEKVDDIVGTRVNKGQCSYRWLAVVGVVYVGLAGTAWIAGTLLPDHIRRDPASRQAPIDPTTSTTARP